MKITNFINNEGKDKLPKETIAIIRNILSKIGIFVIEKKWLNQLDNFFSVRLEINNTNIGVNGKGVSYQYALASAYGELMERIQNQFLFNNNIEFEENVYKKYGFIYTPDEKIINISEIMENLPEKLKKYFKLINIDSNNSLNNPPDMNSKNFVCLPYYSVKSNKLVYLPCELTKNFFATNGMCAGNTYEEALVQGISEIFERYTIRIILKGKITPPNIPDTFLKKFKKQYNMIKRIEKTSEYKVFIKDLSLEKKIPVIAIIFFNSIENSYFVKFGSSPVFEIALERCLTEFFQGRPINDLYGFIQFQYYINKDKKKISSYRNKTEIFKTGSGIFPNTLFSKDPSYCFNESNFKSFNNDDFTNNSDMFKYCIKIIHNLGFDILCRDVSFINFPAYHIIVPGMSNIDFFDKKRYVVNKQGKEARKILRSGMFINNKDNLKILTDYVTKIYITNTNLDNIICLPVNEKFPLKQISYDSFLSMANYCLGNNSLAYDYSLKQIISLEKQKDKNKKALQYWYIIRDFLAMKVDGLNLAEIYNHLFLIYPEKFIKDIIESFSDSENIFKYFPKLDCWNCKDCSLSSLCYYNEIKTIYLKIKDKIKESSINQMKCKNFKWNFKYT